MTFTGDEILLAVWLPCVLALFAYVGWLEWRYGNPVRRIGGNDAA